jgi:site-specific recombinase XerD
VGAEPIRPLAVVLLAAAAVLTIGDPGDLDATLGGVVGFPALWGAYREWALLSGVDAVTVDQYRFAAWAFCSPQGGYLTRLHRPKPWHKATADDARRWLDREALAGPRRGQPLSARTRRNYITALRVLYAYAYATGVIRRDPMALLRHPKVRDGAPRSLEPDQLRSVLLAAEADDRMRLLCDLGYFGCLRCIEMARLRLEDVHRTPRPGRLHVVGKGGYQRFVPMHPALREALDRYLARRRLVAGDPLVENRRLPGAPLSAEAVSRLLSEHMHAVGVQESGHALRHSGATAALTAAEGANLEEVRELLGHHSDQPTRRYVSGYPWQVASRAVALIPDPLRRS